MKPTAVYLLHDAAAAAIYGPPEREAIAGLVDVLGPPLTAATVGDHPDLLARAELIFSGWGCPPLDAAFLARAPRLKAVFYGAGSVRRVVSEEFWARGLVISSAWAANARPVAEYTLAQILLCLKGAWRYALAARERRGFVPQKAVAAPGAFESVVGLVSLGMIGRRVASLLAPFDLTVIAFDPFVKEATAASLGVRLCPLEELFARADVVSLHTPWLKETEGMITGEHFARLKPGAAFINTARGAVVREEEMFAALAARPDLTAVLDVTCEARPPDGAPHYTLPNVFFTPHIAGSQGRECRRMGRYMVAELGRYLKGEPLAWAINREQARYLA